MPNFAEIVEKFFWQFVTLFFRDGSVFVAGLFAVLRPIAAFVTAMLGGVFHSAGVGASG